MAEVTSSSDYFTTHELGQAVCLSLTAFKIHCFRSPVYLFEAMFHVAKALDSLCRCGCP